MATKGMARQAATSKGVLKRLSELPLDWLSDPRQGPKFTLGGILRLGVLTLASGGNSQREFEARSEQLADAGAVALLGLGDERVADNTFGTLLPRVSAHELRQAVHVMIKAEHRRGNLSATIGGRRLAALDGKVLAPVRWHGLVSAARQELARVKDPRAKDPAWAPNADELRRILALGGMEFVQVVVPAEGPPYGLVRMHRWTLVSSNAAVTIDERPIDGDSNEVGSAPDSIDQLMQAYGRTALFDTVTADAGNTSQAFAASLASRGVAYFLAIKSPSGEIFREAVRLLDPARPVCSWSEERCGTTVAYDVYAADIEGDWHGWGHARQVVRVERVVRGDGPEPSSVGNRYFVTSLDGSQLSARQAMEISRAHWRCENEGHWTADAIFKEDAHRPPLSRHPRGMLVGSLLRIMAQNILAVLRALSRGTDRRKPTWRAVRHHVLAVIFRPLLDTLEFEAVA